MAVALYLFPPCLRAVPLATLNVSDRVGAAQLRTTFLNADAVPTVLLFIVFSAVACLMPSQNDTWWHLRAGKEMWVGTTILTRETFSYTASGSYWPNHEWLTEVIFYGLYAVGGLRLLTFAAATCVIGAAVGCWRLMAGPLELRLPLLCLVFLAAPAVWAVRPQVFTIALLMITAHAITARPLRTLPHLLALPLLFWLWSNLHGAVALGLVLLAAAAIEGTFWSRQVLWQRLMLLILCVAGTFATPLGFRYWTEILKSIQRSQVNQIAEWQPPALTWADCPYWIGAAFLAWVLIRQRRHLSAFSSGDRILLIAALGLGVLAFRAGRNIAPFLLIAAPAISRMWSAMPSSDQRSPRPASIRERVFVTATAVLAASVVAAAWNSPADSLGWRPIENVALEALSTCPDPIFNQYGDGGYLLWFAPHRRVFIDSRQDPYPAELLVASRQADLAGVYRDVFQRYAIRCAFVPTSSPMHGALSRDGWRVLFADSKWTMFRK
jgi:hypothetical protein